MSSARQYKNLTLALIYDGQRILLGLKKRGFGQGRWNGFGGKIEDGETPEEAARRELQEEAGIEALSLEPAGLMTFTFEDPDISPALRIHLFRVLSWKGEPAESEEMLPLWFVAEEVPFDKMWPDDIHWYPFFIAGKKFEAAFHFKDTDMLISHKINVVHEF